MRVLLPSLGFLVLLGASSAQAHGCHRGWQQGDADGWHSHSMKCDLRKGIGLSSRGKGQKRRPA